MENRPLGSKMENRSLGSKMENRHKGPNTTLPTRVQNKKSDTGVQNPQTGVLQNSSTDASKKVILQHGCRLIFHVKIAYFFLGVNVVGHRI